MTDRYYQWGVDRLNAVAAKWGVSPEIAARILHGRELAEFWNWVDADDFLMKYIYGKRNKEVKHEN
jgi:hypothetical protein